MFSERMKSKTIKLNPCYLTPLFTKYPANFDTFCDMHTYISKKFRLYINKPSLVVSEINFSKTNTSGHPL